MIKKIRTYPDPILRKKSAPVTEFGKELADIITDMTETMFDAPGAGLAAPQIGISKQIVVINTSKKEDDAEQEILALINPKIVAAEGSQVDEEGCLSVREYSAKVKRFIKIQVQAQTPKGEPIAFDAEEFFARVIQHELDHLEGVLYIDRISTLKRSLYKKKLKKMMKKDQQNSDEK